MKAAKRKPNRLLSSRTVLGVEFPVERLQLVHILLNTVAKARKAEMSLSLLLAEPASGNRANARLVQQFQGVEHVGSFSDFLGSFDLFGEKLDLGVEVQSSQCGGARHSGESVEPLGHDLGSLGQGVVDGGGLVLPELVRRFAFLWRSDQAVHADLAAEWRAQSHRDHLVHESHDLLRDVGQFEVTTSTTAFTRNALRDGVERDERDVGVEFAHELLERGETVLLPLVQVVLVHFISQQDQAVLLTQADEVLGDVFGDDASGGVTGVDNDKRLELDAVCLPFEDRALDFRWVGGPPFGFVKVVGDGDAAVAGDGGGVERVLRDGDEDAGVLGRDEEVEEEVDAEGGTGGEEDVVGICGVAVTL